MAENSGIETFFEEDFIPCLFLKIPFKQGFEKNI